MHKKSSLHRIDELLKASGAKGIGHNGRRGVCRILCLGDPTSNNDAKRKLRAFLERFDEPESQTTNADEAREVRAFVARFKEPHKEISA